MISPRQIEQRVPLAHFAGVVWILLLALIATAAQAQRPRVAVTGELKRWHKVVLTLDGPAASATAVPNPFLDLRMDVVFTHRASKTSVRVPGYFDADGNAANSSAHSGRKWRAILRPSQVGSWSYRISFRRGPGVAVAESTTPGAALFPFDGLTGNFTVAETDKSGRDFRSRGMLSYVGKHHLQFAGTGEFFLKIGADSPENLLAYDDFDDTPNYSWQGAASATGGGFRHDFAPHVKDWKRGDPTWKNGKGKGLIGAMNYLASKGLNAQSFVLYNTHGDDRNVSPYLNDEDRTRISIPKVNQWEIVFDHMEKLGIYMEMKLMEMENHWDHDAGELGPERKLYYRELIARFGHHLALNWNIGEENTNTRAQQISFADYIHANDPYRHLIIIHAWERLYLSLMEQGSKYRGASLQVNFYDVYDVTRFLRMASQLSGMPWVITIDESRPDLSGQGVKPPDGVASDAADPEHDDARKGSLWANIMAGGAGMDSYLGFGTDMDRLIAESRGGEASPAAPGAYIPDVMLENFRSHDKWWDQMRVAHAFFVDHQVPFHNMSSRNELLSSGWALADAGTIVGYFPEGVKGGIYPSGVSLPSAVAIAPRGAGANAARVRNGGGPISGPGTPPSSPTVDLHAYRGVYEVRWYDPQRGGALQLGSVTTLQAGAEEPVELGQPPSDANRDWAVLIRPASR